MPALVTWIAGVCIADGMVIRALRGLEGVGPSYHKLIAHPSFLIDPIQRLRRLSAGGVPQSLAVEVGSA